jgi:hypothetical protein
MKLQLLAGSIEPAAMVSHKFQESGSKFAEVYSWMERRLLSHEPKSDAVGFGAYLDFSYLMTSAVWPFQPLASAVILNLWRAFTNLTHPCSLLSYDFKASMRETSDIHWWIS